MKTQKQRDRSGSAGGIRIIKHAPGNGNAGTYTIDTESKPKFFNPTNSIPTSIKTGSKGGSGVKGVKIKTPTHAYFSEQNSIVARKGQKGQQSPAATGNRSPMAVN